MENAELRQWLEQEAAFWAAKTFEELLRATYPVTYSSSEPVGSPGFWQAEVELLERTSEYVHVGVAVDDGGWWAIKPLSTRFLVYADGRVD